MTVYNVAAICSSMLRSYTIPSFFYGSSCAGNSKVAAHNTPECYASIRDDGIRYNGIEGSPGC
eukprot:5327819-Pyramimonas_sp.AAC.1